MSRELTAPVAPHLSEAPAIDAPATLVRPEATTRTRIAAIDRVRGLVIVVMALDHVRDYFTAVRYPPTDLDKASVALFLTRWVTHYCAPTFVFLAGLGAYLYRTRRSRGDTARFLLSRGAWLVLLEFTVVNFVWTFNFRYQFGLFLQVIWVIGVSMIVLAALVWLPIWVAGAFGIVMIAGHNLLDGIVPGQLGGWATLWKLLHVSSPTAHAYVLYPLVPWVGVMASGYAFGALYAESSRRRALCLGLGASLCIGFVALRLVNGYGDPVPWTPQRDGVYTALSFLNVSKYPPSLAYLLMTLGPLLIALPLFERVRGARVDVLQTFGAVPLFAYVAHIALAHLFAGLLGLALGFGDAVLCNLFIQYPEQWGLGLGGVYLAWFAVLIALYPGCRWFARIKRTRQSWWLAYL